MRKFLTYLSAVCIILTVSSCQDRHGYDKDFLSNDEVSLKVSGKVEFEYNEFTCQLAYNDRRREYRASTDNMSDYFVLKLSEIPSSKSQMITGSISWTGADYVRNLTNIRFEVIKISDSKTWLWNQQNKIAVVIPRLDAQ